MPVASHLWRDAWLVDAIKKKVIRVKPECCVTYEGNAYQRRCELVISHEGASSVVTLARVVALGLVPNPFGLPDIIYGDGDPRNIIPNNLRWADIAGAAPSALPFTAHDLLVIRQAPKHRTNEDLANGFGLRPVDAKRIRNYPWKAFVR